MMRNGSIGIITNIQRFSLDDGPGIRTTVFLKGCSLACRWCHNPETISGKKQIQYLAESCKNCGSCVAACKRGAHQIENGRHAIQWDMCTGKFDCTGACFYGALSVIGREITVEALCEQLIRDEAFYDHSEGGVTLSGGEPLLQSDFCAAVLRRLKELNIHTALDTAGNVPWVKFETLLPWVDLVLFDIKIIDPDLHRKMTGGNNHLILENFERLCRENVAIRVRTPIIEGVNDGETETDRRTDVLIKAENIQKTELLPYHSYGVGKYAALGMSEKTPAFKTPSPEKMQAIASRMRNRGVANVVV
ncbi:MAG: glycyl-radical enzyme activating protein [Spirochaetaceae bacterium]|jgi:pyruvate formate lyase activating enzyme|nr:glycyl-radical enzyme activating protein [Spirochaetaceae bacterium]